MGLVIRKDGVLEFAKKAEKAEAPNGPRYYYEPGAERYARLKGVVMTSGGEVKAANGKTWAVIAGDIRATMDAVLDEALDKFEARLKEKALAEKAEADKADKKVATKA